MVAAVPKKSIAISPRTVDGAAVRRTLAAPVSPPRSRLGECVEMSREISTGVHAKPNFHGCGRTTAELRVAYFAQAGEIALRYAVVFERVIRHIRQAETCHAHLRSPPIRYVDDVIQAIACIDGTDLAWRDLVEHHERPLVRTCRQRFDPTESLVLVRRLFATLRRYSSAPEPSHTPTLRSFDGSCSLRRWLRERIGECLETPGGFGAESEQVAGTQLSRVRWGQGISSGGVLEGQVFRPDGRLRDLRIDPASPPHAPRAPHPGRDKTTGVTGT